MKKLLFFLLLALASYVSRAQFVRTYNTTPQTQLVFNCITKAQSGNYFVAGTSDNSIYVAEVNAAGNIIQEKLMNIGNNVHNLRSMITDADGNIVIVGEIKSGLPNTTSYLMKISSALSLLLYKTYNYTIVGQSNIFLNDIKDYKLGNLYYLCGSTRRSDNATNDDVLLLTVDRNTGTVVSQYNGHSSRDMYDALVFPPRQIKGIPPGVYATGRLSHISAFSERPWLNTHANTLAFSAGAQYVITVKDIAKLYSSSLITDRASLLFCWDGDVRGNGFGLDAGITSANLSLTPNWQKEYFFTPAASKFYFLNKIAADINGYVAEGNWWDGSYSTNDNAIAGEMILLRTDKTGNPVWSRKLNNIFVNQRSHNASFLIDGNFIYSVGFKPITGTNQGALVQIPLSDGKMDTVCAPVQQTLARGFDYSVNDSITQREFVDSEVVKYYAVNCIQTNNEKTCDSNCISKDTLNAEFDLNGFLHNSDPTYTVTASNFNTSLNSHWIVSEVDLSTNLDFPNSVFTSAISGFWGINSPTNFWGYTGQTSTTQEFGSGQVGTFNQGHKYRFRHILSFTNRCGITINDTVTKVIFMCNNCKTAKGGFIIINEKDSRQKSNNSVSNLSIHRNSIRTLVYPNPAANTINFSVEKLNVINPVLQVFTSKAQLVYTIKLRDVQQSINVSKWASGNYSYNIIFNGKIIDSGKFIIQH